MVRQTSYSRSVFLLVLTATIAPVLLFSMVTTGVTTNLVDSIIETNVSESLETTGIRLEKFTETSGRSLVAIAANLDVLKLLGTGIPAGEKTMEAVDAHVLKQFSPDKPPVELYLVTPQGVTVYSNKSAPGSGGRESKPTLALIDEVKQRPAGITVYARHESYTRDTYVSFSMATAVLGPSGKPAGYVIADIPRETLRTELAPLPKIPDLVLIDNDDYIAFSLSSPEREGTRYTPEYAGSDPLMMERRSGRLHLLAWKPAELVTGLVEKITLITLICLCLSLMLAFLIAWLISGRISGPVQKIIDATRAVAEGDLSVRLKESGTGDIALLMQNFNSMVGDLRNLFDRTVEEQELLKRAELDSLGSQINPHFFFNALSSISALAKLGACGEINTVTIALGKLLRSSLASSSEKSTIALSLAETHNYLTIEKIRFADRFSWTEEVGEGLGDCEVPRLAIQALVENALIHGIEPNPEPSVLKIRVTETAAGANARQGAAVRVEVEDNGVGIGEARLSEINAVLIGGKKADGEKHIGLANANRRIVLEYGDQYGVRLRGREGGGIVAEMTIPVRREAKCTE